MGTWWWLALRQPIPAAGLRRAAHRQRHRCRQHRIPVDESTLLLGWRIRHVPAQIHDCKGAVRWLRANADEYGLDAGRIGAWGPSAGGHLASLLGTSADVAELEGDVGGNLGFSSRIQATADYYGPTDILNMALDVTDPPGGPNHDAPGTDKSKLIGWSAEGQGIGDIRANLDNPDAPYPELVARVLAANPITHVTADDPPFFIAHGTADYHVPLAQSTKLHEALELVSVSSSMNTAFDATHTTGLGAEINQATIDFFVDTLQPDLTPPTPAVITDVTAVNEDLVRLTWDAATDPESGVAWYHIERDGVRIATISGLETTYEDTDVVEMITYSYAVQPVNNSGLFGVLSNVMDATTPADFTRPEIIDIIADGNEDTVVVVFSEPVEPSNATNQFFYSINYGVQILDVALSDNDTRVTLTTSGLISQVQYLLTAAGITDQAQARNELTPGTQVEFEIEARVISGLQSIYMFDEGAGNVVHDGSPFGTPLDLVIEDPNAVTWTDGGLRLDAQTILRTPGPATKINIGCMATDEVTIEAWIAPENTVQTGPARIVTIGESDRITRNVTLGQKTSRYEFRVRLDTTDPNGLPSMATGFGVATTDLQHVVCVRRANGAREIYVDGVLVADTNMSGDCSTWGEAYRLGIGNEMTVDRGWVGELRLVAIYSRALSSTEVMQNYDVGPTGASSSPNADLNGDSVVNFTDLSILLGEWGACGACHADLTDDGVVDFNDLSHLLAAWGSGG